MIDWFGHLYPYTNVHELNLDWIIDRVKSEEESIKNFVGSSVIKYANPIQWDITRQYERNTVVIDANSGDAYVSIAPVPVGYDLSHTEYWMKVFTLGNQLATLESQLAHNEGNSTRATIDYTEGQLIFINDLLYITTADIPTHTLFDVGTNIEQITMEEFIERIRSNLQNGIDNVVLDVAELTTEVSKKKFDLSGRKFIFCADSYGNLGWTAGVISRLGLDAHAINTNGAGFYAHAETDTFLTALQTYADTLTDDEKLAVTDVIVCGGANDYASTPANITAAINDFITYVKTTFPNALIGCGCVSWLLRDNDNANYIRNVVTTYSKVFSSTPGCYYIPNAYLPMHNYENFQADGVHPNTNGTEAIINFISQYLLTGDADYVVDNFPVLSSTHGTLTGASMRTIMDKNGVDVTAGVLNIIFTNPTPFADFSLHHIATISGGCVRGHIPQEGVVTDMGSMCVTVPCLFYTSTHHIYDGTVVLTFYAGNVDAVGICIDVSETADTTATITGFSTAPFAFHVGLLNS